MGMGMAVGPTMLIWSFLLAKRANRNGAFPSAAKWVQGSVTAITVGLSILPLCWAFELTPTTKGLNRPMNVVTWTGLHVLWPWVMVGVACGWHLRRKIRARSISDGLATWRRLSFAAGPLVLWTLCTPFLLALLALDVSPRGRTWGLSRPVKEFLPSFVFGSIFGVGRHSTLKTLRNAAWKAHRGSLLLVSQYMETLEESDQSGYSFRALTILDPEAARTIALKIVKKEATYPRQLEIAAPVWLADNLPEDELRQLRASLRSSDERTREIFDYAIGLVMRKELLPDLERTILSDPKVDRGTIQAYVDMAPGKQLEALFIRLASHEEARLRHVASRHLFRIPDRGLQPFVNVSLALLEASDLAIRRKVARAAQCFEHCYLESCGFKFPGHADEGTGLYYANVKLKAFTPPAPRLAEKRRLSLRSRYLRGLADCLEDTDLTVRREASSGIIRILEPPRTIWDGLQRSYDERRPHPETPLERRATRKLRKYVLEQIDSDAKPSE